MAHVTVTIAEKTYRIACEDGQEGHLSRLAGEVDAKIAAMRAAFGEIGDNRLTVMAAITFLDECEELRARNAELQRECAALQAARAQSAHSLARAEQEIAAALLQAAGRIEVVARQLVPLPSD